MKSKNAGERWFRRLGSILCTLLAVTEVSTAGGQARLGEPEKVFIAAAEYVVESRPDLANAILSTRLACLPVDGCPDRWRADSTLNGLTPERTVGDRQLRVADPRISGNCPPENRERRCATEEQSVMLGLVDSEKVSPGLFRVRIAVYLTDNAAAEPKIRFLEVKHFPLTGRYVVTRESVTVY